MIIGRALRRPRVINMAQTSSLTLPELVELVNHSNLSTAGQVVTPERSKNIATAYRCGNILSDDFAKMPLQSFLSRQPGQIDRIKPDSRFQNNAWLLEVSPNRYMTPFVFKKTIMLWLLYWGNAYVWQPVRRPGQRRELFVLNSSLTEPEYDAKTNELYYKTRFKDGQEQDIPGVEVMHLLINSVDGLKGRSVITYARESLGRQMGAYETQSKVFGDGLSAAAYIQMGGTLNEEAREKVRKSYSEAISGSKNAGKLAVFDDKVVKFETIAMKPVDAQFLESIAENDMEIANFFGMPLYKLNMGKQSYESNEQQNLDYLTTTLDPYLVQCEQAAALAWLTEAEQNDTYFRFNRDVLLRTDAKTRAEVIEKRIQSGVLTPNEGRQIDDLSAFEGGDAHYIPANIGLIQSDGSVLTGGSATTPPGGSR